MRKVFLLTCAAVMLTLCGLPNISEAASARVSFNRGYRVGVRTTNQVYRSVAPRPVYRDWNRGYYAPNRAYYGYGPRNYYGPRYYGRGPGLYIRF